MYNKYIKNLIPKINVQIYCNKYKNIKIYFIA